MLPPSPLILLVAWPLNTPHCSGLEQGEPVALLLPSQAGVGGCNAGEPPGNGVATSLLRARVRPAAGRLLTRASFLVGAREIGGRGCSQR